MKPDIEALRARVKARVAEAAAESVRPSEEALTRAVDAARIATWRALQEWEPMAFTLRVTRMRCQCGAVRAGDCQTFLREKSTTHANTVRLKPVSDMRSFSSSELPREWNWVDQSIEVCPSCAQEFGFTPDQKVTHA